MSIAEVFRSKFEDAVAGENDCFDAIVNLSHNNDDVRNWMLTMEDFDCVICINMKCAWKNRWC